MNQNECEKGYNGACLREMRELDKKERTDVRDEKKKDGGKHQREKRVTASARDARENTRGSERSGRESVHPLGYFC